MPRQQLVITGSAGFVGRSFIRSCRGQFDILPIIHHRRLPFRRGLRDPVAFTRFTSAALEEVGFLEPSVLHLCGSSRETYHGDLWGSIVGTTEQLLEISREMPLRRVVYLSGYGIGRASSERYFRAKAEAERLLRTEAQFPALILRPSYILGRGDELTPQLARQARLGVVEVPGTGRYRIQPLHIDDVVAIVRRALRAEAKSTRIANLLGPVVEFVDLVRRLLTLWNTSASLVHVEIEVLLRRTISSRNPDLSLSELAVLLADKVGEPTQQLFGVRPRNLDELLTLVASQVKP